MSKSVLIIGQSGTGKSTSIRNLNPEETFIINVLNKPLPFRGYAKNYVKENSESKKMNMAVTDNPKKIIDFINAINERRSEIKTLIIDDFQYVMSNEFMREALTKGYDKFSLIAKNAWEIIRTLDETRDDLVCFVLSHSELDDTGKIKCKTIGKMLDDKICLEGMFTIVLHSLINEGEYKFLTQHKQNYLAKSPMGMFENIIIDNDLLIIKNKIDEYYSQG